MEILSAEGIGELGNREIEVWGIKCRGIHVIEVEVYVIMVQVYVMKVEVYFIEV